MRGPLTGGPGRRRSLLATVFADTFDTWAAAKVNILLKKVCPGTFGKI